jgi:hypothetical protein
MLHSTEIYIELYKRKVFDKIPVFEDETGLYYLSEPQQRMLTYLFDDNTFYCGFGGAGMGGKTQLIALYNIFNALSYPDTRWMVGRKELSNLKLTTMQTINKTLAFYGLIKGVDYTYNDQVHKYFFPNESQIILKDTQYYPSDPEMTDLGGLEITGATLDESAENVIKAINILTSRVGRWNNDKYNLKPKIFECFNPLKNHIHTRYWKPWREGAETIDTKFVRSLFTDNPHPEAKKWGENILKTGDKRTIQRLYYGNFDYDDDDNSLVSFDKINDMFTNTFVDDEGQNFLSMDIAITNDRFVCFAWKGMRIKEVIAIKNVAKPVSTQNEQGEWINKVDFTPLLDVIERLTVKYNIPRSNVVYDGDGIGAKLKKYLSGAVAIHNAGKSIAPEYKNLSNELGYKLAEMINSDSIYYDCDLQPETKELIKDELQSSLKRSSEVGEKLSLITKAEVKQLISHSPDFYDAKKYRMLFLITRRQ